MVPVAQYRRRAKQRSVPYAFPLDLRIQCERALPAAHREAEIDGVAEVIAAEAEPQRYRFAEFSTASVAITSLTVPGSLWSRDRRCLAVSSQFRGDRGDLLG